jgi:hypothetical protein
LQLVVQSFTSKGVVYRQLILSHREIFGYLLVGCTSIENVNPDFNTSYQMSVFDTTPRIEYDELDEAIQVLDDKDKEGLEKDLHGSDEKGIEEKVVLRVIHRVASLVDLQSELDSMDPKETQVYRLALKKCPLYVTCESFLLSFLRAEEFHTGNAAKRLVKYWNEKFDLFGEEYTFGPITLNSLQDNDLRVIENGGFSILPKDEHGRVVLHRDRSASMVNVNGPEAAVGDMTCLVTINKLHIYFSLIVIFTLIF